MLLISVTTYCQDAVTVFKHINKKDGLISNNITSLFIDSENFLWIGSQVGLQRYDGAHFKNYFSDIANDSALHSDWISDIFEDSQNRLWIGTDEGSAYILNRKTNQFYNCNLRAKPQNKVNSIWHFAEDKNGTIWIAGARGYFNYNEKTKKMDPANHKIGLKEDVISGTLTIDDNNNFWLSTGEGIKYFDSKTKTLFDRSHNPANLTVFNIPQMAGKLLIQNGKLWIPTSYKKILYSYDIKNDKLQNYNFQLMVNAHADSTSEEGFPGNLFTLSDGRLLVFLIGKGFAIYDEPTNKFLNINAENEKSLGYHANLLNAGPGYLVQDAFNNIITGNETGIQIFNNRSPTLSLYNKNFPVAPVSSILPLPKGDLALGFYGMNGGVVIVDSNFIFKKRYALSLEKSSEKNMIWSMFYEGSKIWAPTQTKSMNIVNLPNQTITEAKNFQKNNFINNIKKDTDGNIWAGSWSNGLLLLNTNNQTVKSFVGFKNSSAKIPKRILSFVINENIIWASSPEGLQAFDIKTHSFTENFQHSENSNISISSNMIFYVAKLSADTLLIGTNMGLNIFDIKKKIFTKILAKDGLANNIVLGILPDSNGKIWVTCSNGALSRIDRHNFSIYNYGEQDGLPETEFSGGLELLPNGLLLLGTANGILSVNTLAENESVTKISPEITGLKINGLDWAGYNYGADKITLSHKQNDVQFSFACFDYWASPELKYYYKIEQLDDKWRIAGFKDVAVYNDLASGNYTLLVKLANKEGVFSPIIKKFSIYILPPFYKTWLFRIALGVVIIGCTFFFFQRRERKILNKQKKKLDFEKEVGVQLRQKLELEKIVNYFTSALLNKTDEDEVVQDMARNLISHLDLEECMIYLWNSDKTKMEQRANFGMKKVGQFSQQNHFDVTPGQGLVGFVMLNKRSVVISDTSTDSRYRIDDKNRLSEITVPIMYNHEIIGIIDSEHSQKNFFTDNHLQILTTIASLMAHKLAAIAAGKLLQNAREEMLGKNEQLSKARLEALRSQMNPHFIFNSLNAIQECIITQKVDAAYDYLSKFSKLQRLVLENSTMEFIPLTAEVEMLNLYLSLEALRFHQSFSYKIHVDPNIDMEEIQLPTMLLQPYVENAIWHGLRNKVGDKIVTISITDEDKYLQILIDDNGVGRKKAADIKKAKLKYNNPVSKGTEITQKVMSILSHKYEAEIEWTIIDKNNELGEATGTKVIIKLPMQIVLQKI